MRTASLRCFDDGVDGRRNPFMGLPVRALKKSSKSAEVCQSERNMKDFLEKTGKELWRNDKI